MKKLLQITLGALLIVGLGQTAKAQANAYKGLWAGEVTLNYVNEVPVPIDENNDPIAPDPEVPTPTADLAQLRLILHVNGSGQVSLLKEVAIMNRTPAAVNAGQLTEPGTFDEGNDNDLSLITEPRLYSEFPPQAALRIASAVFDFGEAQASKALDAIVDATVDAVTAVVTGAPASSFNNQASRDALEASAVVAAQAVSTPIIANADAESRFETFRLNFWTPAIVTIVATNTSAPEVAAAKAEAISIRDSSFFADSRMLDMVVAVTNAVSTGSLSDTSKIQVAHNVSSAYADWADKYHRFIAGQEFGTMIEGVATGAAYAAVQPGATETSIYSAVEFQDEVNAAKLTAIQVKNPTYDDSRTLDAISMVITEMVRVAYMSTQVTEAAIGLEVEAAGWDALENNVTRYTVPVVAPTPDYNAFVITNAFLTSGDVAANAAAAAAVKERKNNLLYNATSVANAARIAALTALNSAYGYAARALKSTLPMSGNFGVGSGDARLKFDIGQGDPVLAAAGLEGEVYLPAMHPTNPFRHRRHPDHTVGYNITRNLRIDFDATNPDPNETGFGVDWISGVYREEVFGIHKPLGQQPDTNPLGLLTEGKFSLQRISTIDALNNL